VNLTTNGGRILLVVVTAFATMAGAVLGLTVAGWLGPTAVGLGVLVAFTSVGAMLGAGTIEYLRRAPHLSSVMGWAGFAGVILPIPVLSVVPQTLAFPLLSFMIGGIAVWVDVVKSRKTDWDG
jgi:hypothetical protein